MELKDSWRIGKAGIQVTRSIGDQDAKADGLTPTPEVYVRELSPEDEFLVFACDGLWDTLSNDQVESIQSPYFVFLFEVYLIHEGCVLTVRFPRRVLDY